jgi:cytochrome P450
LLGILPNIRHDPLHFLLELAEKYGDVVEAKLGWKPVVLLRHPDDLQQVLERKSRSFPKETDKLAAMRMVLGQGLVGASGPLWQAQRRTMQPLFRAEALASFTPDVVALTEQMLDRWEDQATDEKPLDLSQEMKRLTFTIAGRVLFASDVAGDAEDFARAMEEIHRQTASRLFAPSFPLWIPTPGNRRFVAAVETMNRVVYRLIEAQRQGGGGDPEGSLLARLMASIDPETGARFDDNQLRDQVMTLLLAGHETTSHALSWTWHVLTQHPKHAEALRQEANQVFGSASPRPEQVEKLNVARRVFLETLRLYPTTWMLLRTTAEKSAFQGFQVPQGTMLALSPYVTHRHPEFWPDPERFDPDRFLPEASEKRHRFAYLAFGGGPRVCIGANLAVLEARLILSLVLRRFAMKADPTQTVRPLALVSLIPRGGVPVTLESLRGET